ncbi:hypothetical protein BKA69DRAFT_1059808 [Paraphysoderma sedebokerense]|nr:hypothetical protein BKA69DRAFT_1059808 [Paraphysoderma sedebokerense]
MELPYPRPDRLIQTVKGNDSVTHSKGGHDEPPRNPPSDPWSDENSDENEYYFSLRFLPTALSPRLYTYPFKYIQTVYFDLSSRLQIVAMLDFERMEYCFSIFPSPSNLRFVTVQTTNFADGKQGDLVSCDCTPSSNHFRSAFMGKDFPAEPAEKYTQLSKLYECIHTRVACKVSTRYKIRPSKSSNPVRNASNSESGTL